MEEKGYKNVYCNALHPGTVNTELSRHLKEYLGFLTKLTDFIAPLFLKAPADGALTTLYVATSNDIVQKNYKGEYFVPSGVLSNPSAEAKDPELATKLWTFSEELVNEKLGSNVDFFRKL